MTNLGPVGMGGRALSPVCGRGKQSPAGLAAGTSALAGAGLCVRVSSSSPLSEPLHHFVLSEDDETKVFAGARFNASLCGSGSEDSGEGSCGTGCSNLDPKEI